MGIAELQATWSAGGPWEETLADWVARRHADLPALRAIVDRMLRGDSAPADFRSEMDSFGKHTGYGGFKGTSGQMFLNMLDKAADPAALHEALRAALPAPGDEASCLRKFDDFVAFVEETRERARSVGASPPAHGFVPYFLSFFWEAEDKDAWPIYYKNSRTTLARHGLFRETGPLPDRYLRYRERIFELRDALGTDVWGVEALLWHLAEREKPDGPRPGPGPGPGPEPGPTPEPEDLYESYRGQEMFFPDEIVTSLVLSLLTKPFVLLSGISGTGKTQIAVGLAEYLDRRAGGGVVEIEPPQTDEANLYVRVTVPRLRNGHAGLTQDHLTVLADRLPERGASLSYDVTLPDGTSAQMRLSNIDFADPSHHLYRLFFRGAIKQWLVATAEPGDYLRIGVAEDGSMSDVDVVPAKRDESDVPIRRHELIAVRSDWTDPRGLIGYENPLTGTYARTELITLLLRAQADPERPYVVILDEMNLARVEYYFSDFLSAMELPGGTIALRATDGGGLADEEGDSDVPQRLVLPPNVLFIGTVNIDETTHTFSPKVLDRANVIVFNEVDVQRFLEGGGEPAASTFRLREGTLDPRDLAERDASAQSAFASAKDVTSFTEPLVAVHELLKAHTLHFGYRVLHEVGTFVGHALARIDGDPDDVARTAFDLQLAQKVLPKLNGGRELELPLAELLAFCLDGAARKSVDASAVLDEARRRLASEPVPPPLGDVAPLEDEDDVAPDEPPAEADAATENAPEPGAPPGPVAYPRSARELARMLTRLRQTGFVAFLE